MNLIYDAALSFGKMNIASGNFPDVLNLGKTENSTDHYPGKEHTSAGRMTVDVLCKNPDGGTSLTVSAEGSKDGSTGWTEVGKNTFTLEEMRQGPCRTAVSPNGFQYLRVSVTAAGTFTGSAEAFLNTYTGK